MKMSGAKHWQRKTQVLFALLLYRLAQGPVDVESFAGAFQQVCHDRLAGTQIDAEVLNDSYVQVDLAKLTHTRRFRRKFMNFQNIYTPHQKDTKQIPATLTLGDLVKGWANVTDQDETEFTSRIEPKIADMVIEHYKASGQLGFTDEQAREKPEVALSFMIDLFKILKEETPSNRLEHFTEQIKTALVGFGEQPELRVDNGLLHDASLLLTSETIKQITETLSTNPTAKDRLRHPLFGVLMELEAAKYGFESGVPEDNTERLQSESREKNLRLNKRTLSRSLKALGRRSIFLNIDSALQGRLMDDLKSIAKEQLAREENKTQSTWVSEPISPEVEAEAEKRVLDWLFRRNGK